MNDSLNFALTAFLSLLAIVNPVGAIPMFLAATSREQIDARRTARVTSLAVLITLSLFALLGQAMLSFFGITLPAFRAGGGVLLLLMAVSMLHGRTSHVKQTPEEADELAERDSVAVVPLAIPLLSGPGAITTVMLLSQDATTLGRQTSLGAVVLLISAAVFASLRVAEVIQARVGTTGVAIFSRVMGLILAAIAVEFIAEGLRGLLPGLAG